MSSFDAVSMTLPVGRELKPEQDLALLQTYELERVYDLQEQRMIRPISVRDDGRYGSPRAAPVVTEPALVPAISDGELRVSEPDRDAVTRTAAPVPRLAPPLAAAHYVTMIEKPEASAEPPRPGADGVMPAPAAEADRTEDAPPLPYGADAARIRQLVDGMIDERAVVPLLFQYRQPGDLVAAQTKPESSAPSTRRVAAVYKVF